MPSAQHSLSPRERVLKAFNHEEPDRTPIFEKLIKPPSADMILGHPCAQTNFPYRMRLMERGEWDLLVENEARDTVDKSKFLGMDLIRLSSNIRRDYQRPKKIGDNLWQTGRTIARFIPDSEIVETKTIDADLADQEEAQRNAQKSIEADWRPPAFNDDQFAVLRRAKRIMEDEGLDLAMFVAVYNMPVATLPPYMLEWFHTKPELMKRFYQKATKTAAEMAKKYVELGADVIGLGGDLACDLGPMISPAHYREFIAVEIRNQADAIHALGVPVMNASDGDLWPLLDDFLLTTDVDGFEEIDYAAGMDVGRLKGKYGHRITFMGNMDCRYILTRGSTEDVKKATIECIEKGWGDGGHILMSSNSIHRDVKSGNLFAMYEAHREYFGHEATPFMAARPA